MPNKASVHARIRKMYEVHEKRDRLLNSDVSSEQSDYSALVAQVVTTLNAGGPSSLTASFTDGDLGEALSSYLNRYSYVLG